MRTELANRLWTVGLIGVACVAIGSGWYQAWLAPPYSYPDEAAHTGYVLDLHAGRLPNIDGPIDGAAGGQELRDRLELSRPQNRDVWVANNPPAAYLLSAGPAAVSRALGLTGGALLGLRLTHVLAMTGACVLTCVVASRLAGGSRSVGVAAGFVTAAAPHTGYLAGEAMTDGFALLALMGTLEALTRTEGRGSPRWWGRVLLMAALGAAVRPMTAVICAVLVVLVGCAHAISAARRNRRSRQEVGVEQAPGSIRSWMVGLGPALALAAVPALWFARNIALYGDPTGSGRLFEKFNRQPTAFGDMDIWRFLNGVPNCLFTYYDCTFGVLLYTFEIFMIVPLVIAGLTTVGLAVWDRRTSTSEQARRQIDLGIALLLWVIVLMSVVVSVQHWRGGGVPNPRYSLPMVPAFAALSATAIERVGRTVGLLGLWATAAWVLWSETPRWTPAVPTFVPLPPGSALTMSIGPEWWRMGGLVLVALGAVAAAVAILGLRWADARVEVA